SEAAITASAPIIFKPISTSSRSGLIAVFTHSTRFGHCSGSAGRLQPRRMTACTRVHGNIRDAAAKNRASLSRAREPTVVTKSAVLRCQPDKHGLFISPYVRENLGSRRTLWWAVLCHRAAFILGVVALILFIVGVLVAARAF